ncbi:MAG: hypothetical protein ACHQJ4_05995 [Ignavibacteria bacterium]
MMYTQNEVFEPVEVIAHFHNLKIEILRFKWKNDIFKVNEILNIWKIPYGESFNTHFIAVCKDSDMICELSFNHTDMKWELIQYDSLC